MSKDTSPLFRKSPAERVRTAKAYVGHEVVVTWRFNGADVADPEMTIGQLVSVANGPNSGGSALIVIHFPGSAGHPDYPGDKAISLATVIKIKHTKRCADEDRDPLGIGA